MTKKGTTTRHLLKQGTTGTAIAALTVLLAIIVVSCERRDLFVSGEGYFSLLLNVDWSDYDSKDPDGMTVWFFPLDKDNPTDDPKQMTNRDGKPYTNTTANVTRQNLYLPNGRYQGVVINYSPSEYSKQTFEDMHSIHDARVQLVPSSTQGESFLLPGALVSEEQHQKARTTLFGETAVNTNSQQLPPQLHSGYYQLSDQPEAIAADTLNNRNVNSGSAYDDYIPYEERNSYQKTITVNELNMLPHSLVWHVTLRIWIEKGLDNFWQARATLSGLADGHYLARHENTDRPCIIALDEWSREYTAQGQGWITCTIACFGLRPSTVNNKSEYYSSDKKGKSLFDGKICDWEGHYKHVCLPEGLRLNLIMILRDQKTTTSQHFNIGRAISTYDDQLYIEATLDKDYFDENVSPYIDLPEVPPYNSGATGFDAEVSPWEDGGTADETM